MARVGVTPSGAIEVDELMAIVFGSAFFGSGGGGSVEAGGRLADELRAALEDAPVGVVALADLPDQARVAVPASFPQPQVMPSIAAATNAFRALGERTGDAFDAVVPLDLTVHGVLVALGVAVACDVPVVDAAGSVRAARRLDMTTWAAAGVVPGIVAMADPRDVVVIGTDSIDGAGSAARAVLAGDTLRSPIGGASWAMNTNTLRRSSIPAALSAACAVSNAVLDAPSRGTDPVDALVATIDRAVVVGRGRLGRVTLALTGRREHVEIRIDTLRGPVEILSIDSHIQLRSPQGVLVGAPDLISVVTTGGRPLCVRELSSPELAEIEVAVIAAPTPEATPARVPTEAYDRVHATFGTTGPVPFGIHHLDP